MTLNTDQKKIKDSNKRKLRNSSKNKETITKKMKRMKRNFCKKLIQKKIRPHFHKLLKRPKRKFIKVLIVKKPSTQILISDQVFKKASKSLEGTH